MCTYIYIYIHTHVINPSLNLPFVSQFFSINLSHHLSPVCEKDKGSNTNLPGEGKMRSGYVHGLLIVVRCCLQQTLCSNLIQLDTISTCQNVPKCKYKIQGHLHVKNTNPLSGFLSNNYCQCIL